MKNLVTITIALLFSTAIIKAQTTAMDFNRHDCNGTSHHLFQDLDAGKAVILFFYMPNCGSCPPPAKAVNAMVNNFHKHHPGTINAYLMPYNNTTNCTGVGSFITKYSIPVYTPLDSGATQVAYYGGMGMPTVVLLGGKNHRVVYNSQTNGGFSTKDTTTMRDSIMKMMGIIAGINSLPAAMASLNVYPNPASDLLNINIIMKENVALTIDVMDITGKLMTSVINEKVSAGEFSKQVNIAALPNGNYLLKVTAKGASTNYKVNIVH